MGAALAALRHEVVSRYEREYNPCAYDAGGVLEEGYQCIAGGIGKAYEAIPVGDIFRQCHDDEQRIYHHRQQVVAQDVVVFDMLPRSLRVDDYLSQCFYHNFFSYSVVQRYE